MLGAYLQNLHETFTIALEAKRACPACSCYRWCSSDCSLRHTRIVPPVRRVPLVSKACQAASALNADAFNSSKVLHL